MKKLKILYVLIPIFLFSCQDWLDVTPQGQVGEKELFESSQGYRNALLGVYNNISTKEMYGKELTWGYMDVLAQTYDYNSLYNLYDYAYLYTIEEDQYDYKNSYAKQRIDDIWLKSYNAIANCNNIIQHLEEDSGEIFNDGEGEDEFNLVKGEAYALRAFLHFDLLRIFGPSFVAGSSKEGIPYSEKFPSIISEKKDINTILDKIISDLEIGEQCTHKFDSINSVIMQRREMRLEHSTAYGLGDFLSFRGYRLNYYAIKALKARVYLYKGDMDKALKEAKYLIDLKYFKFTNTYDIGDGITKLYDDVIFALYNDKLSELYESCGTYGPLELNNIEELFEVELNVPVIDDIEKDYRYARIIEKKVGDAFISKKYFKNDGRYGEFNNKMIPVIRFSEMLLIYAECMYDFDKEEARLAVKKLRDGRGSKKLIDVSSKENFMKEIKSEYQKEFIGEGQMFYFYKRLNLDIVSEGHVFDMSQNFVIPTPDLESVNN